MNEFTDNMMSKTSNILNRETTGFFKDKHLVQLVLAVYLGTVLQDVFTSIVQGFIMPLLLLFIPNVKVEDFEDIQIIFMGARIQIGRIIYNIINLTLGFIISYIFVKYIIGHNI